MNGFDGTGIIGNDACNAPEACQNNKGTTADNCCNYHGACPNNTKVIHVGDDECSDTEMPSFALPKPPVFIIIRHLLLLHQVLPSLGLL